LVEKNRSSSADPLTRFLARAFTHVDLDKKAFEKSERASLGILEAWVSIVGNAGLFLLKIFIGLAINSISLIVDAFHTLSDVATSVIVLFGFRVGAKPADEDHPYGHGKAEIIGTFAIALLLVVVALEFLWSSVQRLISGVTPSYALYAVIVMLFSTLFKEWMARFSFKLGGAVRSQALVADAWHHRSDAVASALVVVALVGVNVGYGGLDALFGVVIALLIGKVGYDLLRGSYFVLMDRVGPRDLVQDIRSTALSVPGVIDVHKIHVRSYGSYHNVELHVLVEETENVVEAHAIAHKVKDKIEGGVEDVEQVLVHIEPHEMVGKD
jgi:cation diffusion facilitator family transporter